MGWILASKMSAMPLLSAIVKALAIDERKRVRRYV